MAIAAIALAASTLAMWLGYLADVWFGRRGIADLRRFDSAGRGSTGWPTASVVVAARDEQRGIEAAVRSLLALDYPGLEIVVVDDRSQDETPRILARIARREPRLRVVRVEELPGGWLGKNHALAAGAAVTDGELLLFTDADVRFEPDALRKAVAWLEREQLDHVAGAVDVEAHGAGLQLFVVAFPLIFNGYLRPWRAADADSPVAIGIGAFNLLRRSAYESIGGHESIRMRPDDDLQLGVALKRAGFRQQLALLVGLARVEWYPDLRSAVRGLEKNSLAAVDYRLWMLIGGSSLLLVVAVVPFVAPWFVVGAARWLWTAAAAIVVALAYGFVRETRFARWTALAVPLGVLLVIFTTTRAAVLTYWHGGIRWRGTFYALADLRAGEVKPS